MIIINPSILSGNFSDLKNELIRIEKSGTNMVHLDIMDGMFVPNITFGHPVVKNLRPVSNLLFDVHLMIENPIRYIENFACAGADLISFHYEACDNRKEVISKIKESNVKAAIAIKPNTTVESIYQYLDDLDMVLIMTVYPGFSGQKFIPECLKKIETLRNYIDKNGYNIDIEVDGGINSNTIIECAKCGANIFVSGSTLFDSKEFTLTLNELKQNAEKNFRSL